MPNLITAVFENGVFRPLKKVRIKEHEKVELKVISNDGWKKRFNRVIRKLQAESSKYHFNEIENDIRLAVKESREEKYGR